MPALARARRAALSQRGRPQVGAPGPHHKGPAVTPLGPPTLITRMQLAPPGGGGGGGPASSITGNLGAGTAAAVARASLSLPSLIKQQLGLAVASPGAVEPLLPGGGGVPRVGGHSAAGGVLYGLHRAGGIVIADADDGLAASSSGLSSSEEEGGAEHAGGRGPAAAAFDGAAAGAAGGKLGRVVFGVAQARCARPYMGERARRPRVSLEGGDDEGHRATGQGGTPHVLLMPLGDCAQRTGTAASRAGAPPAGRAGCWTTAWSARTAACLTGTTARARPSGRRSVCTRCWRRSPPSAPAPATWGRPPPW